MLEDKLEASHSTSDICLQKFLHATKRVILHGKPFDPNGGKRVIRAPNHQRQDQLTKSSSWRDVSNSSRCKFSMAVDPSELKDKGPGTSTIDRQHER